MASYSAATKTGRMNVVRDLLKGLSLGAATGSATNPTLVIGTSALSGATGVLGTIVLPNAGVTVSGSVLTLIASPQSVVATGAGTAAKAELRDNAGTVIDSGLTVGVSGSGADVIIGTTTVAVGQTITVNTAAVTHAP